MVRQGVGLVMAGLLPVAGLAQETGPSVQGEIERLRAAIEEHQKEIEQQRDRLDQLERLVSAAPPLIVSSADLDTQRGGADGPASGASQAVGKAPEEEKRRPEITAISDVGGVLTPRGKFVVEPQIEYSHSSTRRFFFSGVEIVDAVLIGAIEAADADRDTLTGALAARYGITNRLEADIRVPYVYRDDTERDPIEGERHGATGNGIGDIELGLHYQMNSGLNGWPFFIANLRAKSATGKGPFDVDYDIQGQQEDLPTGSGFYSVEPSLTIIYPTDPVVLFGNVGYTMTLADNVDKTIAGTQFERVDPGDVIKFAFGMGIGLNRAISMSLGYEHNTVLSTATRTSAETVDSDRLQIGSFLMGFSLRLSPSKSVNVNLAIGATTDAPDVQLTFRTPFAL
jgi:hypothetical protein